MGGSGGLSHDSAPDHQRALGRAPSGATTLMPATCLPGVGPVRAMQSTSYQGLPTRMSSSASRLS